MDHRIHSAFLALTTAAFLAGCPGTEQTGTDGAIPDGGADEESSQIVSFIRDEVIEDISDIIPTDGSEPSAAQVSELEEYLCRSPNAAFGVYSLRSFDGNLCHGEYVDGLQLVGGAGLLICWEDDYEGFRSSPCAENALEELGLVDFDRDALTDAMFAAALELIERYATVRNPSYAVAKQLFCLLPASMFAAASGVHDELCAP